MSARRGHYRADAWDRLFVVWFALCAAIGIAWLAFLAWGIWAVVTWLPGK